MGGILLLGVGIVTGVFLGKQLYSKPVLQPTPSPVAETTPSPDPTANWKTYKDEKYKYEFRYPNDWNLVENKFYPEMAFIKPPSTTELENLAKNTSLTANINTTPNFLSAAPNQSIDQFMEIFYQSTNPATGTLEKDVFKFDKTISINGRKAWVITGGCCVDYGIHVFVINNGAVMRITLNTYTDKGRPWMFEEVFDQILSTFQFTD